VQKEIKIQPLEMKYSFSGELWKYKGPGGWCFITIPPALSKKIPGIHSVSEEGWGRLKTLAIVGNSTWKTSIWFDTKCDSYLLPVKSLIRKKEKLEIGAVISVELEFELDKWLLNSILR
jgi:hypothetical protein